MINELCEQHFAIIDNFLLPSEFQALIELATAYYTDGQFKQARIGSGDETQRIENIRRDEICWLPPNHEHPAILPYYAAIQCLIKTLNENLYIGLYDFETHFAIYQPGDFYTKHVDQFKGANTRQISCVYYLNTHWVPAHGGELQLYTPENNQLAIISPLSNRFVCFRSHLPHEVYTTHQTRLTLTSWLKTK